MPLVPGNPKDRIILGLMTFGPRAETGARITDVNVLREAFDVLQERGYSEVDTAPVYVGMEQEAFTREAGWKERGITLATKVRYPNDPGMNTAEKVVESVERSLKELGTDCIDVSCPRPSLAHFHLLCHSASARVRVANARYSYCTCIVQTVAPPSPRRWRQSTSCTKRESSSSWASATSPHMKSPRSS